MSKQRQHQPSMISQYSYIRTLEQQYESSAQQRRMLLLIKLNPNCCISGGVETVLKLQKRASTTTSTTSTSTSSSVTMMMNGSLNEIQQQQQREDAGDATDAASSSDPFSFLTEVGGDSLLQSQDNNNNTTISTKKKSHGQKIGGFLKKVAKSTSHNLERNLHNLAIKADGGKNPDVLFVGLYDSGGELLSLCEGQPLPVYDHERLNGVSFRIPLVVPATAMIPNQQQQQQQLQLRLYIRSGAALLLNKTSSKHYLLGSAMLPSIHELHQKLLQSSNETPFFPMTLQLQSNILVDGRVHAWVGRDPKFPILGGRGWSLVDPDVQTAYQQQQQQQSPSSLHRLPLDQSYVFSSNHSTKRITYLATERATESVAVLPVAMAVASLCRDACRISLQHATTVARALKWNRHDDSGGSLSETKASCDLSIGHVLLSPQYSSATTTTTTTLSLHWQRPDSIFEVELVSHTRLPVQIADGGIPFQATVQTTLYPPLCGIDRVLPALKQQYNNDNMPPFLLGNLLLRLRVNRSSSGGGVDPFASVGTTAAGTAAASTNDNDEIWQAVLPLEQYCTTTTTNQQPMAVPVYHAQSKAQMGTVVLQLSVKLPENPTTERPSTTSSLGGLVSLMGLDTLLEDNGSSPVLDWDVSSSRKVPTDPAMQRRQQQLATMGNFVAHAYLQQHIQNFRSPEMNQIEERYGKYRTALSYNPQGNNGTVPSAEDKTPKPFRPSSSRMEVSLSGIPFNVHVHSMAVEQVDQPQNGVVFYNVTHGAPSDHARGFGNLIGPNNGTNGATNSPVGPVSGGLRRLEMKRAELAKAVFDAQSALIGAVANYFVTARQNQRVLHHIPARHGTTATLRWNVFEATQALHHVTWACAARRANVFSQALGIALTSYLTAISDASRTSTGWPDLWRQHGFLITYEGLLSAAGKELGMIEDASVGVSMLRMVSVVLVADEPGGGGRSADVEGRVAIPNSPYLRWIHLTASGVGSATQYRLEVGIDPSYYAQRIPEPLKNGTAVRFYPLLFQVGVDIRQWGANTQKNARSQFGSSSMESETVAAASGGLIDDEEDDGKFAFEPRV
jgi:hypothetical protein